VLLEAVVWACLDGDTDALGLAPLRIPTGSDVGNASACACVIVMVCERVLRTHTTIVRFVRELIASVRGSLIDDCASPLSHTLPIKENPRVRDSPHSLCD
jgi:hypothetical protein